MTPNENGELVFAGFDIDSNKSEQQNMGDCQEWLLLAMLEAEWKETLQHPDVDEEKVHEIYKKRINSVLAKNYPRNENPEEVELTADEIKRKTRKLRNRRKKLAKKARKEKFEAGRVYLDLEIFKYEGKYVFHPLNLHQAKLHGYVITPEEDPNKSYRENVNAMKEQMYLGVLNYVKDMILKQSRDEEQEKINNHFAYLASQIKDAYN